MDEIISKVCTRLVSNPHVIGIIDNSDMFHDVDLEKGELGHVDLCIVSRETGNQKISYIEDGFIVCLKWRTTEQFLNLVSQNPLKIKDKKILYDRIGLLQKTYLNSTV